MITAGVTNTLVPNKDPEKHGAVAAAELGCHSSVLLKYRTCGIAHSLKCQQGGLLVGKLVKEQPPAKLATQLMMSFDAWHGR